MDALVKAHALKDELDGLRPIDAEQEKRIMQKFRLDWNYHSNHLEGNSLTYGETKALILFGITAQGKPLKDHFEMTGHDEAVKWVEEVLHNERPLTETFIRELHTLLLKEPYQIDAITPDGVPTKKWVKVGEYKSTPNHVKTSTGEIFRFSTPEETPAKMNDLIDWYRAEMDKPEIDPILLATEFHYRFIRIHPFDDGNGRTVRILMNFILMQYGYPPTIIKAEDKINYFSALQQADAGIPDPFVEYIAINLIRSLELMLRGAKGESIEEPDDIDKEISLLENKLRSVGPRIEKIKSAEVLKEFYSETLNKVIEVFYSTVSVFDKFYTRKGLKLIIDNSELKVSTMSELKDKLLSNMGNYTSVIKITISQMELNYIGFEQYGSQMTLQFKFDRSLAQITIEGFFKILMYSESLEEVDYIKLRRTLKEKGKEMIDQFIAERKKDLEDE